MKMPHKFLNISELQVCRLIIHVQPGYALFFSKLINFHHTYHLPQHFFPLTNTMQCLKPYFCWFSFTPSTTSIYYDISTTSGSSPLCTNHLQKHPKSSLLTYNHPNTTIQNKCHPKPKSQKCKKR